MRLKSVVIDEILNIDKFVMVASAMVLVLAVDGSVNAQRAQATTKNDTIIHNATNIVPCRSTDNPDALCLSQTQTKVGPGAIRCYDNPSVICYPPQNYTRNYTGPTAAVTPLCTYDPVIVCTVPPIDKSNK